MDGHSISWTSYSTVIDYDYLKALEQFSKEAQSIGETEELGSTLVQLVSGALKCSSVSLLLSFPDSKGFVFTSHIGLDNPPSGVILRQGSLLVEWLEHKGRILSQENSSSFLNYRA